MNYYIFKTDMVSGKTIHICNGSHNDERECLLHWQAYLYGFMDGAFELLGRKNFDMTNGDAKHSFRIIVAAQQKCVEYFMLFDEEGQNLIHEICKEEAR